MEKFFTSKELEEMVLYGSIRKTEFFMNGKIKVEMLFPSEKEKNEIKNKVIKELTEEKGEKVMNWEIAEKLDEKLNAITMDEEEISISAMNSTMVDIISNIRTSYSNSIYSAFLKERDPSPKL